ncbi:catalase [Stylonychia lemnae]|uniref:Catalase n=1 Tax=Stylonychia lemnae TaxID=5949 RepID=A0A078BA53_STYLE|nr:catalase [Stylonychia lemnae]|eukprot:CDW91299.1 catalase [Stylonychia lemnae]
MNQQLPQQFTKRLTTSSGIPIDNNQHVLTAGARGPILLQDTNFINKIQKFDRERIPERAAHAQGQGAHGYFEVTHDVTKYTKAKFLQNIGKRTPLFCRMSTTIGSRGSSDLLRDIRGFALKFYTEDGNYDLVGVNFPVFFFRDPMQAPDFFHAMKQHPVKNAFDPNTMFDFFSQVPESIHALTIMYTDRGTPVGYRHMHGYSANTFKWVNEQGQSFFVKYTLKTDQGIKNFSNQEALTTAGIQPYFSSLDLHESIQKGDFPSWKMFVQLIPEAEGELYKWDIYDVTKVWPHGEYPLIPVGRMVLNKTTQNYFAEVDQVAFNPANLVPGIEPSNDRLLQGRLFLYQDTQLHRLGPNHDQIPINCPFAVNNFQQDGLMNVLSNQQKTVTYDNNTTMEEKPKTDPTAAIKPFGLTGLTGRYSYPHSNDDFEQVRTFYKKVLTSQERDALIENICFSLGKCTPQIQQNMLKVFFMVDEDYGSRVQKGLSQSSISSMVGQFAKKVGLSSDKSQLIGESCNREQIMT